MELKTRYATENAVAKGTTRPTMRGLLQWLIAVAARNGSFPVAVSLDRGDHCPYLTVIDKSLCAQVELVTADVEAAVDDGDESSHRWSPNCRSASPDADRIGPDRPSIVMSPGL
jgi:hypothetical protein